MTSDDYADPQSSPLNHITLLQDHNQVLFISATHDSSSVSCPSFCTVTQDHMKECCFELSPHDHEDGRSILHLGLGNFRMMSTSPLPMTNQSSSICGHSSALYKEEDQKSNKMPTKWMPSTTRLTIPKITGDGTATDKPTNISSQTLQNQHHGRRERKASMSSAKTGKNTIRVCSDCNTTTTPLWRSGPRGPKSLCNACGIRQRKQRKAEAETSGAAANGLPVPEASFTKASKHPSKEKKPRINHLAQFKNKSKPAATCTSQGESKLSFKDFSFRGTNNSALPHAFPRDEVADAALLLMALSCRFPHL